MSEALEIPGRGQRKSSLGSLLQFRKFYDSIQSWPAAQEAKFGAPVFGADLIMPSIVITDVTAAGYIFAAPKDVCDRIGNLGFGPLALRPRIIGPIKPVLVSKDEENAQSRRFIDAAFRAAYSGFEPVLTATLDEIGNGWASRGTVPLSEVNGVGGKIIAKWIMGIDVSLADAGEWPKVALGLSTDSSILNGLLDLATGPGKSGEELADRMIDAFSASPKTDRLRAIAKETGVSWEDGLSQLEFLTLFNTAGLSLLMARTLAQLSLAPDWAAAIRDEVGDTPLTLESVKELPNLRKVFLEASRMFSGPRVFYRVANSAFDLPFDNGSAYRIEKGDILLILKRSFHYDESKFKDPHAFKPERYDDDPDLLNYLYIFGPHERPYRCVAADLGWGATFFMVVLGRLLQGWEWDFSPAPTVSADVAEIVAPDNVNFVNFRAR